VNDRATLDALAYQQRQMAVAALKAWEFTTLLLLNEYRPELRAELREKYQAEAAVIIAAIEALP
jgi:hypothetical protein